MMLRPLSSLEDEIIKVTIDGTEYYCISDEYGFRFLTEYYREPGTICENLVYDNIKKGEYETVYSAHFNTLNDDECGVGTSMRTFSFGFEKVSKENARRFEIFLDENNARSRAFIENLLLQNNNRTERINTEDDYKIKHYLILEYSADYNKWRYIEKDCCNIFPQALLFKSNKNREDFMNIIPAKDLAYYKYGYITEEVTE